jgi:hypothetical protein
MICDKGILPVVAGEAIVRWNNQSLEINRVVGAILLQPNAAGFLQLLANSFSSEQLLLVQ